MLGLRSPDACVHRHLGSKLSLLVFCLASFVPTHVVAQEPGHVIYSSDQLELTVTHASYFQQDPFLIATLAVEYREPQLLPARAVDGSTETAFTFLEKNVLIDCENQRIAEDANRFFYSSSTGPRVGYRTAGEGGPDLEGIPQAAVHDAVQYACVRTNEEHPFRKRDGWRFVGVTKDSRFEIYEKAQAAKWPIVDVWVLRSAIKENRVEYSSVRSLESIDCIQRTSVTLEDATYSNIFATGQVVSTQNNRLDPSALAPSAAAPGTAYESVVNQACKLLKELKPKPKPEMKPKPDAPVERI